MTRIGKADIFKTGYKFTISPMIFNPIKFKLNKGFESFNFVKK